MMSRVLLTVLIIQLLFMVLGIWRAEIQNSRIQNLEQRMLEVEAK